MRTLYFIADKDYGIVVSAVYETKSALLREYDVESYEEVVELKESDCTTEEDKLQFERMWDGRIKR